MVRLIRAESNEVVQNAVALHFFSNIVNPLRESGDVAMSEYKVENFNADKIVCIEADNLMQKMQTKLSRINSNSNHTLGVLGHFSR